MCIYTYVNIHTKKKKKGVERRYTNFRTHKQEHEYIDTDYHSQEQSASTCSAHADE